MRQLSLGKIFKLNLKSLGQRHFPSFHKRVPNYSDMATFVCPLWRNRFSVKKAKAIDLGFRPKVNPIGVAKYSMRLIQKSYIWHEL